MASLAENESFDFWSALRYDGKPIDVMVKPEAQEMFTFVLNFSGIKYNILIENVEE